MAFIATIGVLGFACDSMVRALGRRLTPWSADVREA
jgi:ABC-type nitrate/sulfonate/bicarbonate transport system permease component